MENTNDDLILNISSITKKFGGLVAVNKVSTDVKKGLFKAIIGPNGAGKTTIFNVISGLISLDEGEIFFEGIDISDLNPAQIARLGIARTFQHPSIYSDMTVAENVMVSSSSNVQRYFLQSFLGEFFKNCKINKLIADARKKTIEMLEFVGLEDKCNENADVLTYGEQKVLELARALALEPEPKLLLLDEPTAGLNSEEAKVFMNFLQKLKETDLTILMIEHRMELVKNLADQVLVLNFGEVLVDDIPEYVLSHEKVINAYLGSDVNNGSEVEKNGS